MPGVVSNPSPFPPAFTVHNDAEYEVRVGQKTSQSGGDDRSVTSRRKASSNILTIREDHVKGQTCLGCKRNVLLLEPQSWTVRSRSLRSVHCKAPVDRKVVAGGETGILTCQERHRLGDIVGTGQPSHRRGRSELAQPLGCELLGRP